MISTKVWREIFTPLALHAIVILYFRKMKSYIFLLSLLFIVGLWGCDLLNFNPGPTPVGQITPTDNPPTKAEGKSLFESKCQSCHGANGLGASVYPVSIRDLVNTYSTVHNGKGAMPAFPELTANQVRSIELFLTGTIDGGGGTTQPTTAKALYDANCATCHGDKAQGATSFPSPIYNATAIYTIVHNGRGAMPALPNLSTTQVDSIQTYLVKLRPTVVLSAKQLYDDNCARCHGAAAEGTAAYFDQAIWHQEGITAIVQNGKGTMPAFGLSTVQIDSIQAYLHRLKPANLSGQQVYAAMCQRCHGASGEGTSLGYIVQHPVVGYATYVIRNGRPGTPFTHAMPAYSTAKISATQLTEMLTWLRNQPKPTTGQALYNTYCGNCHGANARGGIVGEGLKGKGSLFLSLTRSGHGGSSYANRISYMPAWSSAEISDADVQLMVQYVNTL